MDPSTALAVRDARYVRGIALCLASALLFALLGPFGKNATTAGAGLDALLVLRFGIAAVVLWAIVAVTRRPLPRGRMLLLAVAMGAFGYAGQSTFYFQALETLSVGLTSLLLYTFPLIVVGLSVLLGRTPPRLTLLIATILAVGGVALTMIGGDQRADTAGVLLGFGAAIVYSVYYFGVAALGGTDRIAAAAVICTAASISLAAFGGARGELDLTMPAPALWWSVAVATVCTVLPVVLLLVGMRYCSPATASLVSCAEPVAAVAIGAAFYADPFGPAQAIGTAAVVAAVLLLETVGRPARAGPTAPT